MRALRLAAAAGLVLLVAACAGPSGPGAGGGPAAVAPVPSGRPAPGSLEALNGVQAAELERRFGAPAFRHSDPPAEVWQYRSRVCTLDLFLYRQPGVPLTVAHATVRGPGGASIGEADCLRAVQGGR
ncbi:hypothetical protein [Phaeospirillum tilakii]|uniref:SmpA / OmlA family protein n=1 Tax=Phaeospirillum tilakii TaxID=741673 RepID=A0ABW5C7B1_9PROT